MVILDTDHLVELEGGKSDAARALIARLEATDDAFAATIVSAEEQMRGWLALIHREPSPRKQINAYLRLERLFEFFAQFEMLSWDNAAVEQFERLRYQKTRIPTMDLKIAAIALAHGALLLSRNLRDFRKVPNLDARVSTRYSRW